MRGRLAAGRLAALVLGIGITCFGIANTARAFEWDLPGERKFSIHGFYEARLLFTGEDLPSHAVTFSQFRHVLSLEFELSLFPDGFGPFDSMFMFTRILASYDCIYTRACGLFASADSYGDAARKAVRQPASLKEDVKNKSPFYGGLLPQVYIPGTLHDAREILNPSRRYRTCDNFPGTFQNPFPLAAFCNLNQRSPLDGPLKAGFPAAVAVRAGDFAFGLSEPLLAAARPTIGEAEFNRLHALLVGSNGQAQVLSITEESERRALLAEAAQLDREFKQDPNANPNNPALAEQARQQAAAILGSPETDFNANIPELLKTRPDPNRFAIFARATTPQLLSAKWGSNKIGNAITPFLATINTPIKPEGYFSNTGAVKWFGAYETGLADDVVGVIGGAPQSNDPDGQAVIQATVSARKAVPFFLGGDGIRDTADDLPFVATNQAARDAGYSLSAPLTGITDRFDELAENTGLGTPIVNKFTETAKITVPSSSQPGQQKTVEVYGVYNPEYLLITGCTNPTEAGGLAGNFNNATLTCSKNGRDVTAQAQKIGCNAVSVSRRTDRFDIGTNADGDCIEVNTGNGNVSKPNPNGGPFAQPIPTQIQYEVIPLLADPALRPSGAASAPFDGSDLRLYGNNDGVMMPARPRQTGNGINFQSPGVRNFYATHRAVVSNLDLHFTEDELQWNHGASQDEGEFAEGYLEFEMADSQIFARVGKLIVIWGKTELFRNQDRNNPLDIGNGLFGPLEEQRVGQWAADVTISPEMFMRVGPVEDLRLELLWIFDQFTPTDLGKCGEGGAVDLICLKSFGAMASGLAAIGLAGERRPDKDYNGLATWDYGARIEGRLDRFTFAISDFWGWDDSGYLDLVQQYERTADFSTGAPLSTGTRVPGTHCTIRQNAKHQAVGPNGIAGDGDDIFASDGNCLLWGKPEADPNDPNAPLQQHLRSPETIASLHNLNQTLFHSVCAFTFDQDEGFCAFDRLNYPDTFNFVSAILGGLGGLGGIVVDGIETIHIEPNALSDLTPQGNFKNLQFIAINPRVGGSAGQIEQDLGFNLQPEQAALLGCGPAYANPCSNNQAVQWQKDPAINNSLHPSAFGGVDLMNADASVVTQEFVALKALEPGALVGTRVKDGKLQYLPGINYSRNGSTILVPDPQGSGIVGVIETGQYDTITPDQVLKMGREGRARYQIDPNHPREADGWIEPMPWQVDKEAKKKFGAIVFENDPNNPFDPNSPLNKWNFIDKKNPVPTINTPYDNVDGEYCERWMIQDENVNDTPFTKGCTVLERASANLERLLISTEIIGFDRVFDPPESLAELKAWGSGNTAKQATGDPIAGPDGIFARNQMVFSKDEVDYQVMTCCSVPNATTINAPADAVPDPNHTAAFQFLQTYNPATCPNEKCFLNVAPILVDSNDAKTNGRIAVIDMPISQQAMMDGNTVGRINLALMEKTDLIGLRRLFSGQQVEFAGHSWVLNKTQRTSLFAPRQPVPATAIDQNADNKNDLDQDRDGIWDGMDDYTPGPITDDNILCGSGVRGDPLQEAAQYDPYRLDEAPGSAKFKAAFPNGLPPRSPVFCRSIAGITGGTTQTLPVKKAGGDGRFGRRDFLWQGGREMDFRYQKRNVMGFGLDFAEDVTKTSWGIEFSWMARKFLPNSTTYSGLSQTDEMVLSISVDRPTFFNFLNPNRSFFINYQMFVRYLPNFQGGTRNNDGNYGYAKGPFSTQMVLTFFTGYFQDRLGPRVSMVYWPMESQYAVLTGLTYRWNDAFSTSIGYTSFFGHVGTQQGAYFPIAQYGSIEQYNPATLGRGVAPVINRDQAELRFRYTW
ncbi:MAG TPA: hypothetical protein VMR86_03435 [Myxococcota bacterium]|nr:hypothetical protein [Myxococcota bacterium]